ncbi:NF-kappa-B essential modulator-like [Pollicipes pollicipes]|uniref:NF-kappa-B essential modulator-like n=1 Tax=Pollicipes pollicipes TaxID=41117 RepID=UPI001884FA9B|nr:NF-kappa-B essential modulator-like [Pollicipes pollicipes]
MDMMQPAAGPVENASNSFDWEESGFELLSRPSSQAPSHHSLYDPGTTVADDCVPFEDGPACDQPAQPDINAQMMSSFLSGSSVTIDLDMEALQTKIRNVLAENLKLRDSIRGSSAALRQQCEILLSWRQDNQRLRQERRQVAEHCQRARDIILELRQENAALKQEKRCSAGPEQSLEAAGLGQDAAGSQLSEGTVEAERSRASAEEEQSQEPVGSEQSQQRAGQVQPEVIALRSQLSRVEGELRDARLEVERLGSKLARQQAELSACRQLPDWRPDAGEREAQRLREEGDRLRRALDSERRQRLELRAWLNGDASFTPVEETLRQSAEQLEMATLRAELARGRQEAERGGEEGGGATAALGRLRRLYESLASHWEEDQAPPTPGDRQRLQVHTDGLQARILSMEELLAARGAECERLQRVVMQLRRDLQAVDILKAQVDVYQQDFHQERRQREQLVSEREQLRLELGQLQVRLRQVSGELQAQRRSPEAVAQAHPDGLAQVETPQPQPQPQFNIRLPPLESEQQPTVYTCPKCDMAFLDVVPLQNHANRCLDEE